MTINSNGSLIFLLFLNSFYSCTTLRIKNVDQCKQLSKSDTVSYYINEEIDKKVDKNAANLYFKNVVLNNTFVFSDIKNNWSKEFSSDYFNIIIKAFNDDYVLIYCPRSGIIAGYKLLPKRGHDIYLLNRKNGKIILQIKCDRGLANGLIYNNKVFLKFIDPEEIRVCEI
jgi:hypothetical protein